MITEQLNQFLRVSNPQSFAKNEDVDSDVSKQANNIASSQGKGTSDVVAISDEAKAKAEQERQEALTKGLHKLATGEEEEPEIAEADELTAAIDAQIEELQQRILELKEQIEALKNKEDEASQEQLKVLQEQLMNLNVQLLELNMKKVEMMEQG